MRRWLLAVALLAGAVWRPGSHAAAQPMRARTIVITPGASVKAYDLLRDGLIGTAPKNWAAANFDDSMWSNAEPVPDGVLQCMKKYGYAGKRPWFGPQTDHNFVFRQSFTLPPGPYGPASFRVGGLYSGGSYGHGGASLWVNGSEVHDYQGGDGTLPRIDSYLHEGKNVIGLYWTAASNCSGFDYEVAISVPGAASPASTGVRVLLPTPNMVVRAAHGSIGFSWQAYPKATRYALQIWLVRTTSRKPLPAGARLMFSPVVTGTYYQLSTHGLTRGTYHWRMVAYGSTGPISPWTSEAAFTLS